MTSFFLMFNPFCWSHKDQQVPLAATKTDAYQRMLEGVVEHAQSADKSGFAGIFFSEQHGNLEGVPEVTNNPVLLNMLVANNTERIKVGQLGIVLPVANPLLVAEEVAQLDQMTKGRVLAGFSRGNTIRWVEQFGQLNNMRSATSDKSDADERNLRAFIEAWQIIKLAWTEDSFSFEGEFWKYPAFDVKWPYPPTKKWGAGIDDDENLIGVGVVPRPYQKPRPRVFSPITGRAALVRLWAVEGGTTVSFAAPDDFNQAMLDLYAKEAEGAGREVRRGEGIMIGGFLAIATTEKDAKQRQAEMEEWYGAHYNVPPYNLPLGRFFAGTPQQVVDHIGALKDRHGVEEFMFLDNVGAPHGYQAGFEMLELLGSDVLPHFQET